MSLPAKYRYTSKKLGEILLESGLITEEELARSIEEQKKRRKRLGEVLIELGFATEEDIARTLSIQLGIPYVDLATAVVEPEAIEKIPEKIARKHLAIPVSIEKKVLTVVMADPLNFEAIKDIEFVSGMNVRPAVSTQTQIQKAIQRYYHLSEPLQEVLEKMSHGFVEVVPETVEMVQDLELEDAIRKGKSPPIIRMVNNIIYHAIKNRASDIHIEPREKSVVIRERVDGLLREVFQLPKWVQGAVTSRIKIMARMDIAEKRIPQDGRIKIRIEDREIDLRVSTLPIQYGEDIVIRVLDSARAIMRIEDLGLREEDLKRLKSLIEVPQGVVLVTGPTGSGKTSTLYAMINHIKKEVINIITLEDPIEYELKGVNQVAINEKTGLTFAYTLRSVLRQDPDVIMVGEMRDAETARIAIQASLTGHLVLSTLHTNTAVAAIARLKNLGVEPYLIASSLNGVIAQRLVRKLCNNCKEAYVPSKEDLLKLGITDSPEKPLYFYRARGCPDCDRIGYKGRIGVFEVLVCNSFVKELITNDAPEEAILKAAVDGGMRYMVEDGIEKVKAGITSVDELMRVLYVKEEIIICKGCARALKSDFVTCPYCGYSVVLRCPSCGRARESEWRFCPYCRTNFEPAEKPTPAL